MAQRRLNIVLDLDTGGYSGRLTQAGGQMRNFSGDVNRASRSVGSLDNSFTKMGQHMSIPRQQLRDYTMILGNMHFAILNVQNVAVGWITSLVKQAAEVERLSVLMKGLSNETTELGKSKEAKKNLESLFGMARTNGVAMNELTDAFVKMKSAGIDPMKGSLDSLVDSVSFFGGTSDTMHRASIAIQQMAGKGVISMEELRQQLGEAVPTAMRDMARGMGMSLKAFTDIVSKGKVQAKPALQLMFREFELLYSGSGEKIANTLNGQLNAFKTNYTELSTFFVGMGNEEGGLFKSIIESMKGINAAMRSNEGRKFMADLGSGVKVVMEVLLKVGGLLVSWRSQIGAVLGGLVVGFAAMKAVAIIGWFTQLGTAGVAALRQISGDATRIPGLLGQMVTSTNNYAASLTRVQNIDALRSASSARVLSQSTQQISALTQQANAQRIQSAAITQNIALLNQQRFAQIAQLNTAKTLHAANISQGLSGVASAKAVQTAQVALNTTSASLIRSRGALRAVTAASAVTEGLFATAVNTASAAQGRMNITTAASTMKFTLMAAASRAAAVAVSFMGRAMNIALGPIGAIAMALYAAAQMAGVFESSADRATAATARLAAGMADLESIKDFQSRKDKNRKTMDTYERLKNPTSAFGPRLVMGSAMEKELTAKYNAAKRENETLSNSIKQSELIMKGDAGRQAGTNLTVTRDRFRNKNSADYQKFTKATEDKYGEGSAQSTKLIDAERSRLQGANAAWDKSAMDTIGRMRDAATAAKQNTTGFEAMIQVFGDATGRTNDLSQSMDSLRDGAIGAGKGGEGAAKGLSAAEKAANKAATASDAARDKYRDMFANVAGSVAQLEEELAGGEGAFAKFAAQVANNKFGDATGAEIAKIGAALQEVDRLNQELDFKKSFGKLTKEMAETKTESSALWASLKNGTWEVDKAATQLEAHFAGVFDGITDPKKIEQIRTAVDQIKANLQSIDAANVVQSWEEETQTILISLMTEDQQRQANFDREIARQRALIDMSKLSATERAAAEAALTANIEVKRARLARENEGALKKMLRDWSGTSKKIEAAFAGAIDGLIDSLVDGKASFADFAKSLIKELVKIILKSLIAYAILSALGMTNGQSLGSFMKGGIAGGLGGNPGGGGGGYSGGSPNTTISTSTGGIGSTASGTGSNMSGAIVRRYATGGWIGQAPLKPGEVPMIGHEGEVVLTGEQQRHYANAGRGDQAPNIMVNVINNSGTNVTAEQGDTKIDGKSMIVDVIVEAMNKEGALRDNLQRMMK